MTDTTPKPDQLRFYTDTFGEHRWTVTHSNGETTLGSTEGYVHRQDAEANARRYLTLWPTSDPDTFDVIAPVTTGEELVTLSQTTLDTLLEYAGREALRKAADDARWYDDTGRPNPDADWLRDRVARGQG